MGLRSDDEDGRDSYQEMWDKNDKIKKLETALKIAREALESMKCGHAGCRILALKCLHGNRVCNQARAALERIKAKP